MNLKQLEYFTICAEQLNFTRAAELCYITQTAMTQQIRALEESLGVKLMIRDKHHVELTSAGKIFYGEAKIILRRSEAAVRMIRHSEELTEGQITVGFIRGYGHSDLTETLYRFRQNNPGVHVQLHRDNEHGLIRMLEDGDLDVAFSVTPYVRSQEHICHKLLKRYPMVVVMNAEHPLANRPYLTYAELQEESFLLLQPAGRERSETEETMFIYERGGFIPKVAAMEAEPETLLIQAAMGVGISILPEYVIHHDYTREDLRIVPLVKQDHTAETLNFEVLWRADQNSMLIGRFLDIVDAVTEE